MQRFILFFIAALAIQFSYSQEQKKPFQSLDVFQLEHAADPQVSPDGTQIVYRRSGFDIMKDRGKGNLWIVNIDGSNHRKLTAREVSESGGRWSPSGDRIVFSSSTSEGSEIYMYWVQSGAIAKISQLEGSPGSITWSPDGAHLAFTMFVPEAPPVVVRGPKKPRGAEWAKPARITDRLKHEADGRGYMPTGFTHIFTIPSNGGTPRQITSDDYSHRGISFSPDSKDIYFTSNRHPDWEYDFRNSEVYKVNIASREITQLTSQQGPDHSPSVSPDGKTVAFLGFKDKVQTYQTTKLHLMNTDGSNRKIISDDLDRSVSSITWAKDGKGLYFTYDDKGNTKVAYISKSGKVGKLADNLGGNTIGRPYGGGSYSVASNGTIVYTYTTPAHPADIAVLAPKQKTPKIITDLNSDVLSHINLSKVEEVWYKATTDGRDVQGWVAYPPNYDASKSYPLIVENHGGPISNYGDRFSPEIQLYAADGYVVFYPNPRGSTSYGEEFGNLLFNNYPGDDYQDVMDGVDHLVAKGIADNNNLFVTGGSAGGIMTAWIIGKNNRFKASAVHKPVMNWISKTLVADNYYGYANSRYPGQPWENFEGYWKFSPISLVGNVETPTMVIVGMNDLRTPPSEAKQLYHALKLRKIETVLVELPGASHGIQRRPSQMISKVNHTLAWFNKYKD